MQKKQAPKSSTGQAVVIFSTAYLPLIGGAELAIKEITDRINDIDFFLITARMNRAFPRHERIGNVEVRRVGIGVPFFDKLISPFACAFLAWRLIKKNNVICFWSMMVTFASGAPFLLKLLGLHKKIPVVLTLQEGDTPEHIGKSRLGLVGVSWWLALRFADRVQVISHYLGEMAKVYGHRGEIHVIPNGANAQKLKMKNSKLKVNENIIITTSRLVRKNGIDVLIEAIAKIKERIPDIQCWIIGDGPELIKLKLQITNYKLQHNVKFFGSVPYEEISDYLGQATIFVRPSRSEGLGSAFLDAMAAGLPIIGTPVGGIPDFLKDGETGLFAQPDDAHDLAEKIERLLNDQVLRERLAENGQTLVVERYNWDDIADRIHALLIKKKPSRVLIATGIYPPDIGGPATYSRTIAEAFAVRGLEVMIITYGEKAQSSKFKVQSVSRRWPKGLRHVIYFLSVLWHGWHADIIFAQQPVSEGVPAMVAAKILRKKFVLKVVGDYAWEQGIQRFGVNDLLDVFLNKKYGMRVELLRKLQSWAARRADRVITVSNYLAGVVARWGVPTERITVIANAVGVPVSLPSKEEARRMIGIDRDDTKLVVSAGRLVPWKGFSVLMDAVAEIARHTPSTKLIVIGSGPQEQKIKLQITNNKLQNNVTLIGSKSHDEVLRYLRAADVFVLNTAYEGFSHLIVEAMAVGTPVITTSAGGNKEIVRDGENALLVPYNNQEKLEQAIICVLRESVVQQTLAENGRKTAARYTKERMVEETLKIIEVEPRYDRYNPPIK